MNSTQLIPTLMLIAACILLASNDSFAQRGGQRKPPEPAEWIEHLDKDNDSKVSESEFDGPAEHFSQFDANGDGYIDESEVPQGPPPSKQK